MEKQNLNMNRVDCADDHDIRAVQQGDQQMFYSIVQRNQSQIFRLAYRFCGQQEDAQDITQEVFYKAYKIIPHWKFKAKFFTWLYQTTLNMARTLRRKRKKIFFVADMTSRIDFTAQQQTITDIEKRERSTQLQRAIDRLPGRQRIVVLLRIYEGLKINQTAEIMRCRPGTVKSLLNQALKRLSQDMPREVVDVR
ncbi:MAG: RNA polymerase sigma factor [Candidatus Omnitrophica bacterium]|nr:RNA polymerase sigma factor [Candidatus Omnitrophota bacterium]